MPDSQAVVVRFCTKFGKISHGVVEIFRCNRF